MDKATALDLLGQLGTHMHDRFPANPERLAQLDGHLATASMVVGHLFDEEERAAR